MTRTITNPANSSSLSSAIIRTELQTLENEITAVTLVKELFPTSSATTVITLSNTPTGIVQISYQGQVVYETKAWTISGVTVTLLFTPEDATFMEALYTHA